LRETSTARRLPFGREWHACHVAPPRTIASVVGTRPNFMKVAPVAAALAASPDEFDHVLIHSGQHYDRELSQVFLEDLGLGTPDHLLGVGSGSHAEQSARVMERLEPVLLELQPEIVLVAGDVNSTMAAALVAAQLGVTLGHIEAGLRSFDRSMPEEINRVIADQVADLLFIHSPEAKTNLLNEGRPESAIHYVGNTMIDTLVAMEARISQTDAANAHGLGPGEYLVVTLHRPALVDGPLLEDVMRQLEALSTQLPVVFPVHPRTRQALHRLRFEARSSALQLLDPLGYLEFIGLVAQAAGVLTDSGGIQEETTYLGIPCFTLRENTERPITCELGTNVVLGLEPERIAGIPERLERPSGGLRIPPGWDGHAADRIVEVLRTGQASPDRTSARD
jgi:UDP-N-acetylglucosamine 2-epimerase (non-hydrolysing)